MAEDPTRFGHEWEVGRETLARRVLDLAPKQEFALDAETLVQAANALASPSAGGVTGAGPDRDELGRLVREVWIRWAQMQPNPKPSWLAPYDELSEPDKEADRMIGETVWNAAKADPKAQSLAHDPSLRALDPAEQPRTHILYKTGDADAPRAILDANGDVALGMCKVCRKAEVELIDSVCEQPRTVEREALEIPPGVYRFDRPIILNAGDRVAPEGSPAPEPKASEVFCVGCGFAATRGNECPNCGGTYVTDADGIKALHPAPTPAHAPSASACADPYCLIHNG